MDPTGDRAQAGRTGPERTLPVRVIVGFAVVAVVLPLIGALVVLATGDDAPTGPPVLTLDGAYATATEAGGVAAVYLEIANAGGPDELVGATSTAAARAVLHATEDRDGLLLMVPQTSVAVAAGTTTALAPGGTHVMLESVTRPLEPGDEIVVELRFARSGPRRVTAPVLSPSEVLDRIDAADGT